METIYQKHFVAYLKTTGELSTWIAGFSFAIGTALFFTAKSGYQPLEFMVFGFYFVLLAIIINTLMLVNLSILLWTEKEFREYFAIKILILLANIPVTAFYLQLL